MNYFNDYLITVYITNHNYGEFIKRAIESVLNQTLQDFELIIVDDGSTDNSREIIEKYASEERIRIIFQKNKGLNVTNNIAIRASRGKYIMRLDADDYLDQNALLIMSNKLENDEDLGLVFPDYYLIDAEDQIIGFERRNDFETDVTLLDQPAHGACTMIRKKFLLDLGGYDENYRCQDGYELWIKFVNKYKVSNINTPLFYYRQHGNNLTANENKILTTRSTIKRDFIKKHHKDQLSTIAILPIREPNSGKYDIAFEKIGGQYVVDIKLDEILNSKRIQHIILTSSDENIKNYIEQNYGTEGRITFYKRRPELGRLNIGLNATVDEILQLDNVVVKDPTSVMLLSIEYPFIKAENIDDAINTMEIFDTDSLISVRPLTDLLYQHKGQGMEAIMNQDQFTKLEREALFRYVGGISLARLDSYKKFNKMIAGKIGHIVIDQKAAHGIFSKYDLDIANFLYNRT